MGPVGPRASLSAGAAPTLSAVPSPGLDTGILSVLPRRQAGGLGASDEQGPSQGLGAQGPHAVPAAAPRPEELCVGQPGVLPCGESEAPGEAVRLVAVDVVSRERLPRSHPGKASSAALFQEPAVPRVLLVASKLGHRVEGSALAIGPARQEWGPRVWRCRDPGS